MYKRRILFENEKELLKIIKYAPTVFVVSITIFILTISFWENKAKFEKDKEKIRLEYTEKNEEIIKQKVYEVYNYIKNEQTYTELELKETLKEAINNAYNIANNIFINNQNKTPEEIKKLITDALRDIRFNKGRGYFFIYENSGKNILLPHNKELEGKNFWDHKDAKGSYIVKDMTNLLSKNDEAFYEWYWYNPKNPDKQRKKIGLVKNLKQFDWFIGTGEYVEDFEKEVQERVLKNIKEIRFGNNGYIFVIDYDTTYLSHLKKNYIGKKATINNDMMETNNVIGNLLDIAKKGEGFYSYIENEKPDNNQPIRKISFVKGLENWSWIIGTGFYEDDVQNAINIKKEDLNQEFKEYFLKTLIYMLLEVLILMTISIYLTKILQQKFLKYQDEKEKQQNIISQQAKMAAIGEMLGNIAHQWRQPLNNLSALIIALSMKQEKKGIDKSDMIDFESKANTFIQKMSSTIDDFKNFFLPNKQKINLEISKVLDEAISIVRESYKSYGISIEIHNEINPFVNTYKNELEQVFINLLNNAKDAIVLTRPPKGKVEIKVETQEDNGGGIDNNLLEKIFEPYFTTKFKDEGTGIGLYMSKMIIEQSMKGTLTIQNHNLGVLCKITLPITSMKIYNKEEIVFK